MRWVCQTHGGRPSVHRERSQIRKDLGNFLEEVRLQDLLVPFLHVLIKLYLDELPPLLGSFESEGDVGKRQPFQKRELRKIEPIERSSIPGQAAEGQLRVPVELDDPDVAVVDEERSQPAGSVAARRPGSHLSVVGDVYQSRGRSIEGMKRDHAVAGDRHDVELVDDGVEIRDERDEAKSSSELVSFALHRPDDLRKVQMTRPSSSERSKVGPADVACRGQPDAEIE